MPPKLQYSSSLTALLTMLGVSVGLGNVWRFPYMMGSYGGSAFLFVYLLFTLIFAYPALMAEMVLGKRNANGTVGALRSVFGKPFGTWVGYLLLAVVTISGSYYAVVVAAVLYTAGFSSFIGFDSPSASYQDGLSQSGLQYIITLVLITSCLWVIHKGLVKGIEWASKIIMPFFTAIVIYIIIHTLALPDAWNKLIVFLSPQWNKLHATEIYAALGQAFFSLGLGGTFVVVYAGYIKKEQSIPRMALYTGLGDVGASLLVSLFLVPSILVFGLDMASGPGLIFNTLPELFKVMPGGRLVGSLFLLALSLVAFLSLVAAYQVTFVSISHERPWLPSSKILITLGVVQAILALPSSLYPNLVGTLDLVFGSGMQVLGSALCVVGLTWGISKNRFIDDLFIGQQQSLFYTLTKIWMRWIVPMALLIVLAVYVYESL